MISQRAAGLLVAALIAIGCDSGTRESSLSGVTLRVSTIERDATGNILIVGDTGLGQVTAETNDCTLTEPPCPAQVEVEIQNSDQTIATALPGVRRTPFSVLLVGKKPGMIRVTARAAGLTSTDSLTVVSSPLAVDSLWVRSNGSAFDSVIDVVEDAAGNLQSVTLPVGGSMLLQIRSFRYDQFVTLDPAIAPGDGATAWASLDCRAPVVDPGCSVFGEAWVTGLAPGNTTVTVTVRNQQRSFAVIVQ